MSNVGHPPSNQTGSFLRKVEELLRENLTHGFFSFRIRCVLGSKRRREVVIEDGKMHRFVIPEEEIER